MSHSPVEYFGSRLRPKRRLGEAAGREVTGVVHRLDRPITLGICGGDGPRRDVSYAP